MTDDLRTVIVTIDEPDGEASPYPIRLVDDPGGAQKALASHDLPRVLQPELRTAREVVLGDDEVSPETVNGIGAALHAALGDVGKAWLQRAWRDDGDDRPARVLLDVRPRELAVLPWEMLFDPEQKLYPFGRPADPAARIAEDYRRGAQQPEREYWPLRILVVVGTEDNKIKAREEVAFMEDALVRLCADIDLEVLDPPEEPQDLIAALKQHRPHILHFIGHGFDDGAGSGSLEFAPEGKAAWGWEAADIRMDLPHRPRLVVLNACRTGGQSAHDGTMSVARAFLNEDVPAVIAMQGPIDGAAAARFSRDLYTALADGEQLDAAVAHGRQGIAGLHDVRWSSRETWLPTLVLGVPPDAVLPPRYRVQTARAAQIRKLVRPLGPFVDRRDDRRMILSRLEGGAGDDGSEEDRLLQVTGQRRAGKTVLVKWAVAQLAFRGEAAVYVNLGGSKERPRFSAVMTRIHKAMCDTLWAEANDTPLDAFAQLLEPLTEAGQPTEAQQRQLCVALVVALKEISERSQVVIALDQIEQVFEQDYGEMLVQRLLRPVAAGAAGNTRLILVHHGAAATVFDKLEPVSAGTLGCIEASTVKPYVRQYFLYHDANRDLVTAILPAVAQSDEGWLPSRFPKLMQGFGLEPDQQAPP